MIPPINIPAESEAHVEEARLLDYVLDGVELASTESAHLSGCHACQSRLASVRQLAGDLRVYVVSDVPAEALARYASLFGAAVPAQESSLARFVRWLTGELVFDSRSQALATGVRSAAGSAYRLLYSAGDAEIELSIEAERGAFRIEGELVGDDESPVLVQLTALPPEPAVYEALGSAGGRFSLAGVRPGRYAMTLATQNGDAIHIPEVEFA